MRIKNKETRELGKLITRESAIAAFQADSRGRSISSIDTLKGFSMMMIFHIHFAAVWRTTEWFSLMRLFWYFSDVFGVATFATMSIVGNMVSTKARWENGDRTPYTRRKLLRLSFVFFCGEVMNLMFLPAFGPFHALVWNVLTGIAVLSLLVPLVLKLPAWLRLLLVVALVALYYPLLAWAMGPMSQLGLAPDKLRLEHLFDPRTMVYLTLFDHALTMPFYPWLIIILLTSVVFDPITDPRSIRSKAAFQHQLWRVIAAGAGLIALGILTGAGLTIDYDTTTFNELLVPGKFYSWPFHEGIFTFLIRHIPQAIFYGSGIVYVWFGIISWIQIVKGKRLPWQDEINNVGRYSLTAYFLTHVAFLVPVKLGIELFYVFFVPCLVFFVWGLWMWNKKYDGIGTMEFAMNVHALAISLLIDRYRAQHGG